MAPTSPSPGPWVVHAWPLAMLEETSARPQQMLASARRARADPVVAPPIRRPCRMEPPEPITRRDERGVACLRPGGATSRVADPLPGNLRLAWARTPNADGQARRPRTPHRARAAHRRHCVRAVHRPLVKI